MWFVAVRCGSYKPDLFAVRPAELCVGLPKLRLVRLLHAGRRIGVDRSAVHLALQRADAPCCDQLGSVVYADLRSAREPIWSTGTRDRVLRYQRPHGEVSGWP